MARSHSPYVRSTTCRLICSSPKSNPVCRGCSRRSLIFSPRGYPSFFMPGRTIQSRGKSPNSGAHHKRSWRITEQRLALCRVRKYQNFAIYLFSSARFALMCFFDNQGRQCFPSVRSALQHHFCALASASSFSSWLTRSCNVNKRELNRPTLKNVTSLAGASRVLP